jgi:hypothetical protein
MGLRIEPLWDPTGAVCVEVDDERRELVVRTSDELFRFVLRANRGGRISWVEREPGRRGVRNVPVSVGEVVCHCLGEWEAEQRVLALSRQAARRALSRGGTWARAGRRLANQTQAAAGHRRVSTLPFRVMLEHRERPARRAAPTTALAAQRSGYLTAAGHSDTQRLRRRAGMASSREGGDGGQGWQRLVNYETGIALCRAVELDPVELGL